MADRRIVSLPYSYEVEVVLPRKTKPTRFVMADTIPVEAAVLAPSEAKKAVQGVDARGALFDLIDVDGVLMGKPDFMKVAAPDEIESVRCGAAPRFDETMLDRIADQFVSGRAKLNWPNAPTVLDAPVAWTTRVAQEIPEYREMVRNTKDEAREAAAAKAAGSLAYVGNALHVREPEPFWDVYRSWGERSSTKIMLWRGHERGHMNEVFRIDRLEDAKRVAEATDSAYTVQGAIVDSGLHAWTFDDDRQNARRWGWNIIGALESNGPTMLKLDRSFWNALLDIRDLATDDKLTPEVLLELVATMQRSIDASTIQSKDFRANFEGSTANLRRRVELFDPAGDLSMIEALTP